MILPTERIKSLVAIDEQHKTPPQLLASVLEELGELARELKIEEKVFGNFHKAPGKDGSKGEAVDLFICANIVMYVHNKHDDSWLKTDWHWPSRKSWIENADVFKMLHIAAVNLLDGWQLGQTCIDIFVQRGGTEEEFLTILNNKLDKWAATQKGE